MSGKTKQKCYNCKREFIVLRKKGRIILTVIVCVLLVAFNIILLYTSKDINFNMMIVVDAVCIFVTVLLFPFTARFSPVKLTKSEKKKLKNEQ